MKHSSDAGGIDRLSQALSDVTETGEQHTEPSSSHQYSSSTYTTHQRTIAPSKVQLTKTPIGDSSSSIDSERSGLSVRMQPGAVRRPPATGYGSETDNLDDYLQVCSNATGMSTHEQVDRMSPLPRDNSPPQSVRSQDSVVSQASLRNDKWNSYYDRQPTQIIS
jgi:hypothetical protein